MTDEEPRRHLGSEELLIRIDERTLAMAQEVKEVKQSMIGRAEFTPVKLIAYGLVSVVLLAVLTAVIAQVVVTK
jgi:hypothetical protein